MRHRDADFRLVVVRVALQHVVVCGERVVVVLLVAIRGCDLQVDDAQRRRFDEDRLVRGDRRIPLPGVIELIGGRELALQFLRIDSGERTAATAAAAFSQREGDGRIRRSDRLHVQLARLWREALHRRRKRPLTGSHADDREASFLVGNGREAAWRRARIFCRHRGAFDRIAGFVLDSAAHAAGLSGGRCRTGGGERCGQDCAQQHRMKTHGPDPLKNMQSAIADRATAD